MRIQFVVNGASVPATLADNPTARDFYAQLPMEVIFEDFGGKEKIFNPPKALSKEGAPAGHDPKAGDITCYAPWGNVAIFYQEFGYASGLIYLGRIEGDLQVVEEAGSAPVRIEPVGETVKS